MARPLLGNIPSVPKAELSDKASRPSSRAAEVVRSALFWAFIIRRHLYGTHYYYYIFSNADPIMYHSSNVWHREGNPSFEPTIVVNILILIISYPSCGSRGCAVFIINQ